MFNAVIERGTGVRRVHITEEAQMKKMFALTANTMKAAKSRKDT